MWSTRLLSQIRLQCLGWGVGCLETRLRHRQESSTEEPPVVGQHKWNGSCGNQGSGVRNAHGRQRDVSHQSEYTCLFDTTGGGLSTSTPLSKTGDGRAYVRRSPLQSIHRHDPRHPYLPTPHFVTQTPWNTSRTTAPSSLLTQSCDSGISRLAPYMNAMNHLQRVRKTLVLPR